MSVLDELDVQDRQAAHVLAEAAHVDTSEQYTYVMHMDTLTQHPETDVRMTVELLHAIFSASHYIFRYRIDSVTVSDITAIRTEDIPSGINIISSDTYEETAGHWSRYRVSVSFDFRTKFKEGHLTTDEEKVTCASGVLRFLNQLAHVCGKTMFYRNRDVDYKLSSSDYHITVKNNDTRYSYDADYDTVHKLYYNKADDLARILRRFLYTIDMDTSSDILESSYDNTVYKYQHRSEVWRMKRNDWQTVIVLSPQVNSVNIERGYGLDDAFRTSYQLTIKGSGIADLYVRYNLLRAVCEFSAFNKLFTFDNTIYNYADLFWHMSPNWFRYHIECYHNEQNFWNMAYAHWILKRVLDAYDADGYGAVIDVLSEELNSKLIASKVKVRME